MGILQEDGRAGKQHNLRKSARRTQRAAISRPGSDGFGDVVVIIGKNRESEYARTFESPAAFLRTFELNLIFYMGYSELIFANRKYSSSLKHVMMVLTLK